MIGKKVKEADSVYSGGSTKRSRFFDDISCSSNASARWTSILTCCSRRNRERNPTLKDYNPNEWDYIVEKLVVKRVPLALYATEDDFREFTEARNDKESSYGPVVSQTVKEARDKRVYTAVSEVGSTLYFLKNKARRDLANRPSNKNLRFNRDEDFLDEDAVQAGPSNYGRNVSSSRAREDEVENAYLNQFSSLHPNLKDSEGPPKDPHPLNPPRSKRSLAEDISEIASSTKKSPRVKDKRGKAKGKPGTNEYIKGSDAPRETSTVLRDEEIPTRDKNSTKPTSSIGRKIGNTSYLAYPQQISKIQGAGWAGSGQIQREIDSPHDLRSELSGKRNDRDSYTKSAKASQFKVHYVSPEHYSSNELAELNSRSNDFDDGVISRRKNHPAELSNSRKNDQEQSVSATTSEGIDNANLTGTTSLRWKIIIKHHQPATESQPPSESASDCPPSFPLPTLNDCFKRPELINANTEYFDKMGKEDRTDK